jgi:hypothetical protein
LPNYQLTGVPTPTICIISRAGSLYSRSKPYSI